MFLERANEVYHRFGFWLLAVGLSAVLLSWGYVASLWGTIFFGLGLLLAVSDPVALVFGRGQRAERPHFLAWGLCLLALAFFVLREVLDQPLDKATEGTPLITRIRYVLLVFFFLSLAGGLFLRLGLALGYTARRSVAGAQERQRSLLRAVGAAVGALVFLVLANYVGHVRNPSWDVSPGYFSFGSNARTVLATLDRKVEVIAFLPAQQMVRRTKELTPPELSSIAEDVRGMLEQLPLINGRISLQFQNADLGLPNLTEFGSVNNGTVIFRVRKTDAPAVDDRPYVERRVYVYNERDLEKFEREVVRALVQVSSPSKNVYFTAANGERYEFTDTARKLEGIEEFKESLRFYNLSLRKLDHQQNWPPEIPKDAEALVLAGPTVPFAKEGREAIIRYLQNGGRVFLAIDPDGREDFDWLFQAMQGKQYQFHREPLSNGYPTVAITDSLAQHPSTENTALRADRLLVLPQMGRFEERKAGKEAPDLAARVLNLKATVTINSQPSTVIDRNRNGKKDAGEEAGRYNLAIAFEPAAPAKSASPAPGAKGAPGAKEAPGAKTVPGAKDAKESKTGAAGTKTPGPASGKVEKSAGAKQATEGARLVVFGGVNWITDRALSYRVVGREHKNLIVALDSMLWLTENPLAATIQPEPRQSRNIQVTDELKFRNILLGMVLFPLLTGGLIGLGVYLYRRRRRFVGEEA